VGRKLTRHGQVNQVGKVLSDANRTVGKEGWDPLTQFIGKGTQCSVGNEVRAFRSKNEDVKNEAFENEGANGREHYSAD